MGNENHVIGGLANILIAFGGHGDHPAGAGFHFLQIRNRLLITQHGARVVLVLRGDNDDGQILVDQRIGTVLHFAGGIAFGVNVGDLFQFERALKGNREVNAAAKEEKVLRALIGTRQFLDFLLAGEHRLQVPGDP